MNIYDKKVAERELDSFEWRDLESIHLNAPRRYGYYRRHYPMETKEWCIEAAKNWADNHIEQKERRKTHGTGAA